jgi:hypothetical protein
MNEVDFANQFINFMADVGLTFLFLVVLIIAVTIIEIFTRRDK